MDGSNHHFHGHFPDALAQWDRVEWDMLFPYVWGLVAMLQRLWVYIGHYFLTIHVIIAWNTTCTTG